MRYLSEEALAERFNIEVSEVARLRVRRHWPHIILGRGVVRFTEAQVAEIERMQTVRPRPAKKATTGAMPGQTGRSAKHSA